MKCPACHDPLFKKKISDVELDVCQHGCGGIWFDQSEFRKFDEPHEYSDEVLDLASESTRDVDHTAKRTCARCEDQNMLRRFYSPRQAIEIDECAMCGGIWLDYGELGKIRNMFTSYDEFRDYAKDYMNREFGDDLEAVYEEWARQTEPYNRFANMFRFLYPSWWIPGDQKWGKF